jgi:hypothetical protein
MRTTTFMAKRVALAAQTPLHIWRVADASEILGLKATLSGAPGAKLLKDIGIPGKAGEATNEDGPPPTPIRAARHPQRTSPLCRFEGLGLREI